MLCLTQSHEGLLIISPESSIVLVLTFKSMIHLELIFVFGMRKGSKLILLHVDTQLSNHHLLKTLFFHH